MLKIQNWLKENKNDFKKLKEEFGINSNIYSDRVVLNYSQLAGDKFNLISKESRSLILSYPVCDKILQRSFDRFFNFGEDPNSDKFDIIKAQILSKEDGSLIGVYHDGKELQISTKSMAFAEGLTSMGTSYKDLVLRTSPYLFQSIKTKLPVDFFKNHTFIFELCTQENRIVKRYKKDELFLLAIRNKNTGKYIHDWEVDKIADSISIQRPEEIFINSWDALNKIIKELPTLDEGYVCVNDQWRIKVKNPAYVAVHHLRDNGVLSPKRISDIVFMEETSEYLSYYPEDEKFFKPYIKAYVQLKEEIQETWQNCREIKNQKEFALKVKDLDFSAFMFNYRKGKDFEVSVNNLKSNKKLDLLESRINKDE